MLRLNPTFDTQKDVVSSVLAKEETIRGNIGKLYYCCCCFVICEYFKLFFFCAGVLEPRILNVERYGVVLYSWRVSLPLVSLIFHFKWTSHECDVTFIAGVLCHQSIKNEHCMPYIPQSILQMNIKWYMCKNE